MAIHFAKITLIADGTPQLMLALGTAKAKNVTWARIYAEAGNTVDAANGPARYGDKTVDWTAATAKGLPIQPGLQPTDLLPCGNSGIYDLSDLWLSGKTGDIFQLIWLVL